MAACSYHFYSLLQHMLVLEAVFFHSQPIFVQKFSEKGVFFQVRPMVEIMLLGIKDLLCDEGADFQKKFDNKTPTSIIGC